MLVTNLKTDDCMQASSLLWVEFVTELSVEECRAGGASTILNPTRRVTVKSFKSSPVIVPLLYLPSLDLVFFKLHSFMMRVIIALLVFISTALTYALPLECKAGKQFSFSFLG